LLDFFERSYVESLPADTSVIILDIDTTDDETHGAQQLSFFHGFYDHHMYHPVMVYDGDSGQPAGPVRELDQGFNNVLQADRVSCSTFRANFVRLLLHLAAYRLLHALRVEAARESAELGKAQFDTPRLRLLKVAALVSQSVHRIWVRLPRAFPFAGVFRHSQPVWKFRRPRPERLNSPRHPQQDSRRGTLPEVSLPGAARRSTSGH
jgi:hypothetical protein